jgi:hypothetical protein
LPVPRLWVSILAMDIREFTRAFARSPYGIGSALAALGLGAAAAILGTATALSVLVAAASFAVLVALGLGLGLVQRAAVAESERESGAKAASRLAEAASARKRLAAMRITQGELAAARDLVVLEAGRLVEDCSRAGTWDPEGVAAVVDSLALVDAWLKEADESSVEKRFGLPDANPFPEAAARTARALRDKAAIVAARRAAAAGEIPGADRIAIEEELK